MAALPVLRLILYFLGKLLNIANTILFIKTAVHAMEIVKLMMPRHIILQSEIQNYFVFKDCELQIYII